MKAGGQAGDAGALPLHVAQSRTGRREKIERNDSRHGKCFRPLSAARARNGKRSSWSSRAWRNSCSPPCLRARDSMNISTAFRALAQELGYISQICAKRAIRGRVAADRWSGSTQHGFFSLALTQKDFDWQTALKKAEATANNGLAFKRSEVVMQKWRPMGWVMVSLIGIFMCFMFYMIVKSLSKKPAQGDVLHRTGPFKVAWAPVIFAGPRSSLHSRLGILPPHSRRGLWLSRIIA